MLNGTTRIQGLTGIDQARADGDHGEAFRLELHRPLDRRDVLCRLCHPICGHVSYADAADELGVYACGSDEDDAFHAPCAQEG